MADNYFNINATNTQAQYNLPLPPEQSGGGVFNLIQSISCKPSI